MKQTITNDFESTQELGKTFAKSLKKGTVIALHGNLGAGKTTFVQGLAKGLGIEKNIISPTFIIMRTYELPFSLRGQSESEGVNGKSLRLRTGKNNFYHVDLYRIETEHDVEGLGLLELMNDPENIIVIEWPDKIEHLLPENRIDIYFEYLGDDKREIKINV